MVGVGGGGGAGGGGGMAKVGVYLRRRGENV